MSAERDVARAIDALRRGWVVHIDGNPVLAVESADDAGLAAFDLKGPADLLISGNRAETLRITNRAEAVPTAPVRLTRDSDCGLAMARAIADPALDLAWPLKGPFRPVPPEPADSAALRLARLAGLLPALFVGGAGTAEAAADPAAIQAYGESEKLTVAARARLPIAGAAQSEIVAFRTASGSAEPVALLIGQPDGNPPLVRIHSECLTGDALGSRKCDCGPQLRAALRAIANSGWGILVYLRQEGRGIGLVNKLRAYALQDQGYDTVDANLRLGFADDERDFGAAARVLLALSQLRIRLLTNNPRKNEALAAAGIEIVETVPLMAGRNRANRAYLETKKRRSGHDL